ncbi:nucleoside-diphosphate-sugar epimerase [Agromyces sp. 3263]|uniref:NAD(P)-binding oxidoreductase n=1 Tax=Agromyces sp. 3263 TaxID=2817750 RepID=UPI0028639E0A|nr:NAD(P)H-binding protein [Agromyces sp. 3263]MDR6906327.1 nucleoside-diphosphate-sugar epimerase [Agromyces sp. 3263]
MRVVIAGGHGKIALILERLLAEAGHEPVAIIRNPDQRADVDATGAVAVVLDLEHASVDEVGQVLKNADAAVFAAGAGPGSSAERKFTVDRDAAILLADAAEAAGVSRLVVVSAIATDEFDADSDDVFQLYLRAKSEADASVRERDLDWTIVRPGGLTNEPGTGRVRAATAVPRASIPRADVAATIAALLASGAASRTQFELVSGDDPIDQALASLGGPDAGD